MMNFFSLWSSVFLEKIHVFGIFFDIATPTLLAMEKAFKDPRQALIKTTLKLGK
jgi:hypothetical protein